MKEGHLFRCCIYVKKWKSSFKRPVTIQGMQPWSSRDVSWLQDPQLNHRMWRVQAACCISYRAQHISPVMLLLIFCTDNFPLRSGVFCHVYAQEKPDPPGDSSVQCMWRMKNWLALNSPFIRLRFFLSWLCCPFHLCMSSLTSLISAVWRSQHHPTGEGGHAFVTHSCEAALFSGFNYTMLWVSFASVPRWKLLGDSSLHPAKLWPPPAVISIESSSNNSWVIVTLF